MHAAADAEFAEKLEVFLRTGCDVSVCAEDGRMGAGEDLISAAETGLSADTLILLLTPVSNLSNWVRQRWEPVLVTRAAELGTRLAVIQVVECNFPGLLKRGGGFFDVAAGKLEALRKLKRWIWSNGLATGPAMTYSADLEPVYAAVSDVVGCTTCPPEVVLRFAREARREFQAVIWVPGYGRTLAQLAGEAGTKLGLKMAGPVEEDCAAVKRVLSERRCLLVLDAPSVAVDALLPEGRSSVLITSAPAAESVEKPNIALARRLVAEERAAEAYEVLSVLLEAGVETDWCARQMIWINEQWDRVEEANRLRFLVAPSAGEQLVLF